MGVAWKDTSNCLTKMELNEVTGTLYFPNLLHFILLSK